MRMTLRAMVIAIVGVFAAGTAGAETPEYSLLPPVRQTGYDYESYYAHESTAKTSEPTDGCETNSCTEQNGCAEDGCANGCAEAEAPEPCRIFDCCALQQRNITIAGWLSQSFFWNPQVPTDGFNGPVTFNDRSNEYQLNQLYLFAERATETDGSGISVGGRIDTLYGSDWRFTYAQGLEVNRNNTASWNQQFRFYGLALPQAYAEVMVNKTKVKVGHFYTLIGYEVVPATGNFFSSHAYTMQYGEPFTHTGILATRPLGEELSVSAGITRGWDNWEDTNDKLAFLGGVTWTPADGTSLAWACSSGYENIEFISTQVPDAANRYVQSIVLQQKLGEKTNYVFQTDYGIQQHAQGFGVGGPATWYGVNQYLFYTLTDEWTFGMRFEWFRDNDGYRVGGLGYPRGWTGSGYAGNFWEYTWGLNWSPNPNVIWRNEIRFDWYDGAPGSNSNPTSGPFPYDNGTARQQLLIGTNLILQF